VPAGPSASRAPDRNRKIKLKILLRPVQIVICIILIASAAACSSGQAFRYESDASLRSLLEEEVPMYPEVSFAVFSDPHVFAPSLGIEGEAFEAYLTQDRKLLRESTELLEAAVENVKNEDADFVLVPGDLTKDGERDSHEVVADYLGVLEAAGKPVYVIPGNHDILNPHSFEYIGDRAERVPGVTPDEFAWIYGRFGYDEALYRDPTSLSYVAEPQDGLWLLALDSCIYGEGEEYEHPVTDGRFSPSTLRWIEDMLEMALKENRAVIVMMHHGVLEHYRGQEKYFGDYVVDDYQEVSRLLAMYNVRLVFTGHYHSQDITVARWEEEDKFLFDVETGALVTYPCPYRTVTIDGSQRAAIRTTLITSIPSHPEDFPEYAYNYVVEGVERIAASTVEGYKVNQADAKLIAKQVTHAFVAHYAGDEELPPGQVALQSEGIGIAGRLVVMFRRNLIQSLWHDLEPPDNNVVLNLTTGSWERLR
jgi:3',5'-cyclic AMP phosphodiesterase CpdA